MYQKEQKQGGRAEGGGGGSEGGNKCAGGRVGEDVNTKATGEQVELWEEGKMMLSELLSALIFSTLCCCMPPPTPNTHIHTERERTRQTHADM